MFFNAFAFGCFFSLNFNFFFLSRFEDMSSNHHNGTKSALGASFEVSNSIAFLSFVISYFAINISLMYIGVSFSYLAIYISFDIFLFAWTFLSSSHSLVLVSFVRKRCRHLSSKTVFFLSLFFAPHRIVLEECFKAKDISSMHETPDSHLVVFSTTYKMILKRASTKKKKHTWENIGSFFQYFVWRLSSFQVTSK